MESAALASNETCEKVYFDATVLKANDITDVNKLFPNIKHLLLEAENIYMSQIDVRSFSSLEKLELIVTPSDNYPTLLTGKVDEDDDESTNAFKMLHTEE